jgi:transketolase
MRNSFIDELTILAEQNDKIFLMVGDLGYGVIEHFEQKFPKQFLNAGVAEQNMMGMAAGLASAGYKVYVYSIGNFPVFRCLEQIRNDVCYHELDVSIVSIGAGLSYGTLGYSHHAIDDVGVMNALPGLTIYSPADPLETRIALRSSMDVTTPKYFRLGKSGEPNLFENIQTQFPNWTPFATGTRLILLTTGAITVEVIEAEKVLCAEGIDISVYAVPVLKPFKFDRELIAKFDDILIVEEHSIIGGLGTIVSEQIALHKLGLNIFRLAIKDYVHHELGSQKYLRKHHEIDSLSIVNKVKQILLS